MMNEKASTEPDPKPASIGSGLLRCRANARAIGTVPQNLRPRESVWCTQEVGSARD